MRKPIQLPLPELTDKRVTKIGISVGIAGAEYLIKKSDAQSTLDGALDFVLNKPNRFKVFIVTFDDKTEARWGWNVQQEQYAPLE